MSDRRSQDAEWNGAFWMQNVRDGKVVQGRGGWLFLANDTSRTMDQHSGALSLSPEQLDEWRELLEARVARLAELGAPYFFVVAPDAHSVYPEKLPEGFEPVAERPVHKVMSRLAESGSPVDLIYPLEEIVAAKPHSHVYSAYDTHWTELGALIGYTVLMNAIREFVPVRQIAMQQVLFSTRLMPGDLSAKLGIEGDVEQLVGNVYRRARLIEDNRVINRGSHVVVECDAAPDTTCVMFGDSYSAMLLRYMAESFGRFVFAHMPALDYELIERERPDVVVSLMAERFLIEVPDDSKGDTLAEFARQKQAKGILRERLPFWDRPFEQVLHPPDAGVVERMRAALLAQGQRLDATLVCAIAYAGLNPAEVLRLRWRDISEHEIAVDDTEGGTRTVRLLAPLAEDLDELAAAAGGEDDALVFAADAGWDEASWMAWRETVFAPAARDAGCPGDLTPHALLDCFGALLAREGVSWEQIALETGGSPAEALARHGYAAEGLYRDGPLPAAEQVRAARESVGEHAVTSRSGSSSAAGHD